MCALHLSILDNYIVKVWKPDQQAAGFGDWSFHLPGLSFSTVSPVNVSF